MGPRRKPAQDAPQTLSAEQRERIKAWCSKHHPRLFPQLGRMWGECRDWHLANGVQRSDFEAAFRCWIRKAQQFDAQDAVHADAPRRAAEPDRLGNLIPFRRRG